jgi:hypothetical protein
MRVQDPPEYYDPPGGLLSFDLHFNGLLTVAGPTSHDYNLPSKQGHFDLVHFELLQVPCGPLLPPSCPCGRGFWNNCGEGFVGVNANKVAVVMEQL